MMMMMMMKGDDPEIDTARTTKRLGGAYSSNPYWLLKHAENDPISRYSANQIAPFQPRDTKLAVRSEFLRTVTKVEMATKLQ